MIIRPSSRLNDVGNYYFADKLDQIRQMNQTGPEVINLGVGSPDIPAPLSVIERLNRESRQSGSNMYQPYKGIPALRKAFSDWYGKYFHTQIDPDTEILPLIGSKEGIMHLSMSFLEEGDKVLVPNPGYLAYPVTARLAGASSIEYNLSEDNNWLPDLNELARLDLTKVKMMWINYPHMPTGAKANANIFRELIAFAKNNRILICHDNPYTFILNDHRISILAEPNAKDCCVELVSLSKCYNMAGWRIGALCGAKNYVDTVLKFKSNMDSGMFRPIQEAAVEALKLDENWFRELNAVYFQRREKVWEILDLLNCTFDRDTSGMFVWAKAPDRIDDVEEWVEQILQEARVFLTPGFIFGSNGLRYIRISLCQDIDQFQLAYYRIEQFVKSKKIIEIQ